MHIAIEGRRRLSHIIDIPPRPSDPTYQQWKQRDSVVLSWIITNIEVDLVNQFLDYETVWDLWKGIETLLSRGRDELQIFYLSTRAAALKQKSDTIEIYFSKLNTIWKEIDRRMLNPMTCAKDITTFNNFIQRQRLYQFLVGIHEDLDKERRDLLNQEPLPNLELAYATIRREISRHGIMRTTSSLGLGPSKIGKGLTIKYRSETSSRRDEGDRSHLRCSHCGGTRHTKEGFFKLVGYPEWWDDHKKRKATAKNPTISRAGGKAHLASGFPIHDDSSSPGPTQGDQDLPHTDINRGHAFRLYRGEREG